MSIYFQRGSEPLTTVIRLLPGGVRNSSASNDGTSSARLQGSSIIRQGSIIESADVVIDLTAEAKAISAAPKEHATIVDPIIKRLLDDKKDVGIITVEYERDQGKLSSPIGLLPTIPSLYAREGPLSSASNPTSSSSSSSSPSTESKTVAHSSPTSSVNILEEIVHRLLTIVPPAGPEANTPRLKISIGGVETIKDDLLRICDLGLTSYITEKEVTEARLALAKVRNPLDSVATSRVRRLIKTAERQAGRSGLSSDSDDDYAEGKDGGLASSNTRATSIGKSNIRNLDEPSSDSIDSEELDDMIHMLSSDDEVHPDWLLPRRQRREKRRLARAKAEAEEAGIGGDNTSKSSTNKNADQDVEGGVNISPRSVAKAVDAILASSQLVVSGSGMVTPEEKQRLMALAFAKVDELLRVSFKSNPPHTLLTVTDRPIPDTLQSSSPQTLPIPCLAEHPFDPDTLPSTYRHLSNVTSRTDLNITRAMYYIPVTSIQDLRSAVSTIFALRTASISPYGTRIYRAPLYLRLKVESDSQEYDPRALSIVVIPSLAPSTSSGSSASGLSPTEKASVDSMLFSRLFGKASSDFVLDRTPLKSYEQVPSIAIKHFRTSTAAWSSLPVGTPLPFTYEPFLIGLPRSANLVRMMLNPLLSGEMPSYVVVDRYQMDSSTVDDDTCRALGLLPLPPPPPSSSSSLSSLPSESNAISPGGPSSV